MQSGDWRLQEIGGSDDLPLILAAYWLVIIVLLAIMLKLGLVRVDDRRSR